MKSVLPILFLTLSSSLMSMHVNHLLMRAFHNTHYYTYSDDQFLVTECWDFMDQYQALLLIRHDVAPENNSRAAQPFCTCIYYRMLKTDPRASKYMYVQHAAPDYLIPIVNQTIAHCGLPDLYAGLSPNIKIRED